VRILLALLVLLGASVCGDAFAQDAAHEVLVMLRLPPPHRRLAQDYGGDYTQPPGQGARHRIAAQLARDYGLQLVADWAMPDVGVDCHVMRIGDARSAAMVVQAMAKDRRAEWVQPVNEFRALAGEDSLRALQPGVRLWHVDELHRASTGKGVRVAILDSGVDAAHPALAGRVAQAQDFVDGAPFVAESHGTAVASIIGAGADDGARIVGIAPQAELLALRACREVAARTSCDSFSLAKALQFAIRADAQVVNLSLAGPDDKLLGRLIDVALERGASVVGAFDAQLPDGGFPAAHRGVLAVAASSDSAAAIHVRAPQVVFAPGSDVPSAAPGARWDFVSGSSFAAAHVAGLVALVRERAPQARLRDASAFVSGVEPHDGGIDACATLRQAAPALRCVAPSSPDRSAQASW
jgi:subtilisin family serine protease